MNQTPCRPLGPTPQVLNMCLLERREEGGPSSAFTTGSSSTYRRSLDTSTTKATASMQTHPRYTIYRVFMVLTGNGKNYYTSSPDPPASQPLAVKCLIKRPSVFGQPLVRLHRLSFISSPPQVDLHSLQLFVQHLSCTLMRNLTSCYDHVVSLPSYSALFFLT